LDLAATLILQSFRRLLPPDIFLDSRKYARSHWPIVNSEKNHPLRQPVFCAAIMLLAVLPGRADDSWQIKYAPLGTLLVTQFVSAPFPHPARADGHKYHDQFFSAAEHYSNSDVAIFIPKNFRGADRVDFVIHFHGWNHTVAGTLPEYKLIEQFSASGKNAILIVPQGPFNVPDSFGGKLEDTNGFKHFMDEAVEKLRASGALAKTNFEIGNIIISGHSGGYHVMAAILDHGELSDKIREVWLFDALYGGTENFVAWQKNENGRLLDIYTDHGGTKEETENLMGFYKTNGVSFFASEDTGVLLEDLEVNKIVFLHTDMVHNDVVAKRRTFEQFLKTSCLKNKPGVTFGEPTIYIGGDFINPGSVVWTNGMTLRDALVIGVLDNFAPRKIYLLRADGSHVIYKWTEKQPLTNNPVLKPGDRILSPRPEY
jgi:hypothetical protein